MSLIRESIVLVEPLCWKKIHYAFNRSIIGGLSSNRLLSIIGDRDYVRLFEHIEHKTSIRYRNASFFELLRRYVFVFRTLRKYRFAKKIFLSFDNIIFPVFVVLLQRLLANSSNFVIMHNNLPGLVRSRWKRWLMRTAITKGNFAILSLTQENHKYCQLFFSDSRSVYLPHPLYLPQNNSNQCDSMEGVNHKFVFIGRQADLAVESGFIYQFVTILNEIAAAHNVEAEVIVASAAYSKIINVETNSKLSLKRITHYLSFDEYSSLIECATFVVFPDSSMNKLRASGVLIDCISLGTPFLAPSYGHFVEFRNCGLSYSDILDLREKLNYIMQGSAHEYLLLKKSIKEIQQHFASEHHRILNLFI